MNKEEFAKELFNSIHRKQQLKKLSNKNLTTKLIEYVWAEFNIFTYESDLIEEVIERLYPDDNSTKPT